MNERVVNLHIYCTTLSLINLECPPFTYKDGMWCGGIRRGVPPVLTMQPHAFGIYLTFGHITFSLA